MSNTACDLAEVLRAAAILVPTFTGGTASAVAARGRTRRSSRSTHHETAVQQMAIEWGVTPILIPEGKDVEDLGPRRSQPPQRGMSTPATASSSQRAPL